MKNANIYLSLAVKLETFFKDQKDISSIQISENNSASVRKLKN